ncbi:pantoate--beta-alanine ligase [Corynebacterium sp. 320]|uniref:pantoate--beta-alanine ligase n=1 Tax=Corynebacterium TaxID=1716 RepID=UPI00125CCF38|nr:MULTISPECIES: pantoate--beta-alanine ligase [Corynebacterium]KAB1503061.1 pantoate--beta-alanine ligase [Corynebacterium sp. 320]KAB1550728.1 pantoate--beta-alanine ligase [Corynebacterium sp. 321]KAB1551087.1 pantoate--beta-alanine ligase [Corynebacterium sp. 319]KAB3526858.1 pantoate--beta-alanine ligase [Corynebacterium sp. 250]KAB3538351.1 pantoate--beta-alanine ligase [Corynebacterium sp. 366]
MSDSTATSSTQPFERGTAKVFTEIAPLSQLTRAMRKAGRPVVLVPTMGALHEGHVSLVRSAQRIPGALVVVSIFVNPLQFAEGEDLDAYPRTLEADVEKLKAVGVDAVFAPSPREMYPNGPRTTIHPGPVGSILEGAHRPTHFAGVLTVVNKLFTISNCNHAFFGEKDYQQLMVIQQMVTDLNMDVQIHGVPIVREANGLAMSSRNAYLSAEERELALTLSAALTAGSFVADKGAEAVLSTAREILDAQPQITVDYLELLGADLGEVPEQGDARLLVAARVGSTRLIDNVGVPLGTGFKGLDEGNPAEGNPAE